LAQGVIELLREHQLTVSGARITGLIGAGNNGGDGLWALSFLARRGAHITAICTAERVHPEGAAAFRAAGGRFLSGPETADYARADVV
ncbi:NAD(P)H-hydrate epimerase, partial [Halomonas sp. SIMBA_159]